jgi:hypothetical protein
MQLALFLVLLVVSPIEDPIRDASELRERLLSTTQDKVERMGYGAHLWRRYGLQMELLREHLEWLDIGLTDRQVTVIQICVLGILLERADKAIDAPADEEQRKYRLEIITHRDLGYILLKKKLKELGAVTDRELRFRL